jgi:hypothetical protein
MRRSELLIIAGVFNDKGGTASPFAEAFAEQANPLFNMRIVNGGTPQQLEETINSVERCHAVVWIAHVDDSSYVPRIKEANKRCLLVQARRNDRHRNTLGEIVTDMLKYRINLCLVVDHDSWQFDFKVIDALGNLWYEGADASKVITLLKWYICYVLDLTKVSSVCFDVNNGNAVIEDDFYKIIRLYDAMFKTISGKLIEGLPDDESLYRFIHGYPSMRVDDVILVSGRSIEGGGIGKSDFMAVEYRKKRVFYSGGVKPSSDAAVHLQLYDYYKDIKYIIHGHCYVEHAPTTMMHVPCGYLEEVEEIKKIYQGRHHSDFVINVLGHGCYICAENLGYFTQCRPAARAFPEKVSDQCIEYLYNWKHV